MSSSIVRTKEPWGTTQHGHIVEQYHLTNNHGAKATIVTYGATLTHLSVPGRDGKLQDVVLGFDDLASYENHTAYFGCTVGRVANRIRGGKFELDGRTFYVPVNTGPTHLHGGIRGYDRRVWRAEALMTADGPTVRLRLNDTDGTEGYPGNVNITVIYSLTQNNTLKIQYYATSDQPTPINLTNHSYFHLGDGGKTHVKNHLLRICADAYTQMAEDCVPDGKIVKIKGTDLDFTSPHAIGERIKPGSIAAAGYDFNYVLRSSKGELALAAEAYEPESGRFMEVWTTEPGVQLYTSNFLDGSLVGKQGAVYQKHHGFCLETQHFPNAVNEPKFPSTILKPGQMYRQITEHRFSVKEKWNG